MSLMINTNVSSLNAQRQLVQSGQDLSRASERLSSGKRINSAADDAAGLVISNRMTAQVRGLEQAKRNALDGISLIQVAEGALDESTNILQRIRELSIQASNGIYSNVDRATLDAEVQQLVSELDRISETTQFNGRAILDGSLGTVDLQVGAKSRESISFSIQAMSSNELGLGATTGDVIGAAMDLDGTGTLTNALAYSALKINDQTIGGLSAGDTVQDLVDKINTEVDGITASTIVSVVAPATGNGVLTGGEALNIVANRLNGTSQSFSIEDTTSIEEMVEKINTAAGSLLTASVSDEGRLVISSDQMASITLQDTTQGTATGINETQIADPDIAEIVEGLSSSWVSEAEQRIATYYGITGDGAELTLDLTFTDGPSNALASVSWTGLGDNMKLNIDMVDYSATGDPSGGSPYLYMDRIIAHEMTHAVMVRNMDVSQLAGWFTEGTAELIHGGDERVLGDAASLTSQAQLSSAFATGKGAGSNPTALGYSAAYTAVKMMHDDILAAGGAGIIEIFDELKGGATLNAAITTVSGNNSIAAWNSLLSFEADFDTNGFTYMGTLTTGDTDTGAIGGSDYGGAIVTEDSIIPNNNLGPSLNFDLIIPEEYSGGLITSTAQLVLEANDGSEITIAKGAKGTDADLLALGLQTTQEGSVVVGQAISVSGQNAALSSQDLTINGVIIENVEANSGVAAKVTAINNASDETGVVASVYAEESFEYNTEATTEYRSSGPLSIVNNGVLGFNGVGFTVDAGDTAYDIAADVNATTSYHGVKAYVDEDAQLHIFSNATLTPGDSVGGALITELGLVADGPSGVGSVQFNGVDISLTDITNQATTVTEINQSTALTGITASTDNNGNFKLSANTSIQVGVGNVNGMQTLHAMGIDFGITGTESLTDTNSNNLFGDDTFSINARIKLDARNDAKISIRVTEDGTTATGLQNLNTDEAEVVNGKSLSSISVSTVTGAQAAISAVDNALESINETRSQLGAVSNRLEFTVNNLMNTTEKTASARSRIVDADFAKETTILTRAQVLQQASQSMLAQANAQPQRVLQLLG